jgi:hypothetical protein
MLNTVKRTSIYQPQQQGLKFPEVPSFANVADERRHRRQRLVAACRAFAVHGLESTKTTASSLPAATASTQRRFGSSRWNAAASSN